MYVKVYLSYTLLVLVVFGGLYSYIKQPRTRDVKAERINFSARETVESTFEYAQEPAVFYAEKKEIEADDFYEMDEFGNYLLSAKDLESMEHVPVNEHGKIPYNVYIDQEGNILNPMPDYYASYEGLFEVGSVLAGRETDN